MKGRIVFACLLSVFSSLALLAQNGPDNDPDGLRGYVDNVFHHGQVDSVNLYNGLLTVPIALGPSYPIGPKLKFQVMLAYSSRINEYGHPSVADSYYTYFPYSGDPALGLGWTFTLGAIKSCGGVCYIGPDGSQHIFDLPVGGYPGYLKTNDGAQLMLHDMGSGGPYEMWDADGNHSVFNWNVTGNDDPFTSFTHDFGRGRNGWYLTSLTDPFGNGLTVSYRTNVAPAPCAGYSPAGTCNNVRMLCPSVVNSWIPQTINLPTGTITVGLNGNSLVNSFTFPVVANGSVTTATWTLGYQTGSSTEYCDDFSSYTFIPWLLQSIQLPASIGSFQFTYGKVSNCNSIRLSHIGLPTGAALDYLYGYYSFYHGRLAALNQNCNPIAPDLSAIVLESSAQICGGLAPGGPLINGGNCDPADSDRYLDQQLGVVQRAETVGGDVNTTDYVQFAFPFGENGTSPTNNCDGIGRCGPQTLTVVVNPAEKDDPLKRRARGVLFWSAPKVATVATYAGDRTGADIEERVYNSDPTQGINFTMPACGSNPFCANNAVRVTQRTYEYDIPSSEVANRRLTLEKSYHQPTAANGVCSGCKYHQVSNSPVGSTAWESNGRHYNTESHTGNLGNDIRTITTTWTPTNWMTPNGQTILPNLYNHRLESDSSNVDRYFEFNGANGFLNCSFLHDASRQRVFFNPRYPNGDGTLYQDFTASATGFPNPPYIGQCTAGYPNPPYPSGVAIGANGDAFGKIYTYQNGLLNTVRWINGNTPASWYAKNYTRDSGTGWITASSDTAGKTTSYQYDSLGRVTLIAPPDGEASSVVNYSSTTRTTSTRNGGTGLSTYQQYEYDGLGRLSRDIHQMPGVNQYAVRTHAYDGPGRQYFDSEWAACTNGIGDCLTAGPGGTTSSSFDPFGRAQTTVRADGSTTNVSFADSYSIYSDTKKTVTIHNLGGTCAGGGCTGGLASQTTYFSDAFGHLTSVMEPDNAVTSYTYDVNAKLTTVTQAGLPNRTFTFDPAGFLRSETTPEKGTVTYTDYGSLGNVMKETEPDGIVRENCYDFAGRVTETRTSESGTPLCSYETGGPQGRLYLSNVFNNSTGGNSLGKLTTRTAWNYPSVGTYSASDTYTYNGLGGRLSNQTMAVSGGSNLTTTQSWFYNGLGLPAHHYHARPSGQTPFVVSYDYDAGLPVKEYANGIPVVTGVGYQASGALSGYATGINVGHNVTTTIGQDPSLLPRPLNISTSGASTNFATGNYSYDGAGNIMVIGLDAYGYDLRSRLTSASLSGIGSQSFTYDQYGNLLTKGGTTFCSPTCTNNQVTGGSFLRGNLTSYGGQSFAYDGLDRMTSSTQSSLTWNYVYDGSDERTAKIPPTGSWTYTVRDEGKRVASEFSATTPSRDNVFLGSQLVASYANGGVGGNGPVWVFFASDHLGTPRLLTDIAANLAEAQPRRYWPYGEAATTAGTFEALRFATMEFDAEGGTSPGLVSDRYYDHARSHVGGLGRFLSTDKLQGKPGDPQSWNRYAYALNNPLKHVDLDGQAPSKAVSEAGSLVFSFLPVAGDVQDVLRAATGYDPITAEQISTTDRFISGVAAIIPFVGGAVLSKAIGRGVESEARVLRDIGEIKNTEKVVGKEGGSIPDFMNAKQVGEIKDTKRVTDSPQLRIQREAAAKSGREHVVITGDSSKVSRTVERKDTIIRRPDLGHD